MSRLAFACAVWIAGFCLLTVSPSAARAQEDPCVPIEACFPPPQPPGAISGPGLSTTGNYTLTWGPTEDGLYLGYSLEESTNGGPWVGYLVYSNVYEVVGKPPGSYTYRVQVCLVTCSGYPNTLTVTVTQAPPPPTAPTVSISPMAAATNYQHERYLYGFLDATGRVELLPHPRTQRQLGGLGERNRNEPPVHETEWHVPLPSSSVQRRGVQQ